MGASNGPTTFLWTAERVTQSKAWVARGRVKAPQLGPCDVTLGLPTFIGDDLEAMRNAARQNLALYTTFPFFQRLFRLSGLLGPLARCRERLAAFRTAGVDLPILVPPIGVDGARAVMRAFRR